jgi:hypothetical protein
MHLRSFFQGAMKACRISYPVTSTNLPIGGQSPLKSVVRTLTEDLLAATTFYGYCLDRKLVSARVGKWTCCPLYEGCSQPLNIDVAGKLTQCGQTLHASLRHKTTTVSAVLPRSFSYRKVSPPSLKNAAPSDRPQLEWLCAKTSKPTHG